MAGNLVDYDGVTRTYNAANQMVNDGTNTLTYDNNGNLRTVGSDTYVWDRANRLLSVGNHSYVYDGLGNRVQQTVSSVVTDYLNDVQPGLTKLLAQSTGATVDRFVHGLRGIHAVDDGTDWSFYAQDGLGSVRAVVDDVAVVQSSMSYDPYGMPLGTTPDNFGFTGEQTDANGSVFLRARYYEPQLGIFSALDPFEGKSCTPMSLNGYSWVHGNPIMNTDPSGMTCNCEQYHESGDIDLYTACITNPANQHDTPQTIQSTPRFFDTDDSPLVFEAVPPSVSWISGNDATKAYETFRAISANIGRSLSYEEMFGLIFAQELIGVIGTTLLMES